MSALTGVHGPMALALLGFLLFAEEAGVPLPLLPGDLLLIVGGTLAANRAISLWALGPVACLAVVCGAMTAYAWSRRVGTGGLRSLAERLRATRALEVATTRIRSAGATAVIVGRLLPGTRVYTNMVAGASRMEVGTFLLGAVPSAVLWVAGFTAAGYLVGVPAEHYLSRVERYALNAGLLLGVAALAYLGLRHLPARRVRPGAVLAGHRSWRMAAALVVDVGLILAALAGVDEVVRDLFGALEPDETVDAAIVLAATLACYVAVARWGTGATAGEGLLAVSYRPRRPAAADGPEG